VRGHKGLTRVVTGSWPNLTKGLGGRSPGNSSACIPTSAAVELLPESMSAREVEGEGLAEVQHLAVEHFPWVYFDLEGGN
jgi:hypothetical protein